MMTDIRYAIRQLFKSPGFTAVAILTIALGIGACTAIFSVVNGVLLQPLNYPHPEQIVAVREKQTPKFPEFAVSPADFADFHKQAKTFQYLAAYAGAAMNLTGEGEPQRIIATKATADYFNVYGIQPVLGRTFLPEEDAPGKNNVVVLSNPFWKKIFAGAPNAVNRSIQLNGEPYTVIGVAPPGFGSASKVDAWVPMAFKPEELSNEERGAHYVVVSGRLKPGMTAQQADADLKLIAAQLEKQYPGSNSGWSVFAKPMLEYIVSDIKGVLYTLLAAVGCVLLIACANIANLLLARASARYKELSIRAALGAARSRLIRQMLTESVLLAVIGGAAGVLLAEWALKALVSLAPADLPRTNDIKLDAGVLIFAFGLSLITGLVFGAAPAWLAARANVNDALKQASRGSTEGGRTRLRGALVIAEVAVSVVLLTSAGLLIRSFSQLQHVDPGFNPSNAAVVRLTLPQKKYAEKSQQIAFSDAVLARVRALPGVESAGVATVVPMIGDMVLSFNIDGRPAPPPGQEPSTNFYTVTPDFFHAMGIRLVRGRLFTEQDNAQAPGVTIINETFARQHFPNEDPIGKRVNINRDKGQWAEIVGIVRDVVQYGLDKTIPSQAYEPFAQRPDRGVNIVVRTSGSSAALMSSLRPAVYAVDKDQPVASIQPLEEILSESVASQRFGMLLLSIFSGVALVIAAVGIYGVMAYTVVQRTGELGIRMALGAQRGDVLRLVLLHGGRLIGAGILLGLVATFATSRAMRAILFQTSVFDPATISGITVLLAMVAFVACLIPAVRATRVSPIESLRTE